MNFWKWPVSCSLIELLNVQCNHIYSNFKKKLNCLWSYHILRSSQMQQKKHQWKVIVKTVALLMAVYWQILKYTLLPGQLYMYMKLTLLCVNSRSGLEFEKAISPKIGCNLQMNFLHARLLHKSICPDFDWTQLNDPIHIPDFFTRQCFPFSHIQKSKISMFSGATSVTDWAFFCATNLLLGYHLEQNDTGKSLCSFKDKGDSIEVAKLHTATFHQWTK